MAAATLGADLQAVVQDFCRELKQDEIQDFKLSSYEDIRKAIEDIQERQSQRRNLKNLTRIKGFLEAMQQFGQVIEVFINVSPILCFVWGPLKLLLLTALNFTGSFDRLLEEYERLSNYMPLLGQYQDLFKYSDDIAKILPMIYKNILDFHLCALRIFNRPTWKLLKISWNGFRVQFDHIVEDLKEHRALLETQAKLLRIQESRNSAAETHTSFIQLQQIMSSQFREHREARAKVWTTLRQLETDQAQKQTLDVYRWLNKDTTAYQEQFLSVRSEYPSTGLWILLDPTVKAWMDPTQSLVPLLWINGKPGAGKTILTSIIVDECQKAAPDSTLHFYCRYQDEQCNNFPAVVRSLLSQFLGNNKEILPFLYDEMLTGGEVRLASANKCTELLRIALSLSPVTTIIIDGVDECMETEWKRLISCFTKIIEDDGMSGRLRLLFVSQDVHDIRKLLEGAHFVKVDRETHADITIYTTHWSDLIQKKFDLPDQTREFIKDRVCEFSEGMFLYAKLVLRHLYSQSSKSDLEKEIMEDSFPQGFEQAYERISTRVFNNPDRVLQQTATQLLGLIVCARRPLRWHELQGALSINSFDGSLDFEGRYVRDDFEDLCGSLIEVLPGRRIQLVHLTAKTYLIQSSFIKLFSQELDLANICLKYLTTEDFVNEISESTLRANIITGNYAFQDYAIVHWLDHLEFLARNQQQFSAAGPLDSFLLAVNDFQPLFIPEQNDPAEASSQSNANVDRFSIIAFLTKSGRSHMRTADTLDKLGDIGRAIVQIRSALESFFGNNIGKLQIFYGDYWFKCPYYYCYYFHEGFQTRSQRDDHVRKHQRPFCCAEIGCPRMQIGFESKARLTQHIKINHPDPSMFPWNFPKVKEQPQKNYKCELCDRNFTKAHSLNRHMKIHLDEKPFRCRVCGLRSRRKYDHEKHGRIHDKSTVVAPNPGDEMDVDS